jgi:hypothetical protein
VVDASLCILKFKEILLLVCFLTFKVNTLIPDRNGLPLLLIIVVHFRPAGQEWGWPGKEEGRMGMARRRSGSGGAVGELERVVMSLLHFDRLWWWLAVVAALALLGQEIAKSSAVFAVAAEFEGFGDELEEELEDESDSPFTVPPPLQQKRGFQNDHGPPESKSKAQQQKEWDDEDFGVEEQVMEDPPRIMHPKESKDAKVRLEQIWDEDEFEGLPVENVDDHVVISGKGAQPSSGNLAGAAAGSKRKPPVSRGPQSYYIEVISVAFMIAFGVMYYYGRKENEKLALAWARQYAGRDSIMEKNFSLLGTGDGIDSPLLVKEGQNTFKFYASGRRFCEGLLATMDLKNRHDLIALMWYQVMPRKDELMIEVFMNDDAMEPIVFALARKKVAKVMHKETRDLNQFASILSSPSQRKWVTEELVVISESRELANDLLTDTILDQVRYFTRYCRS